MSEHFGIGDINEITNNEVTIDEFLITCVSQKQGLYDYRIPASSRANLKKKTLWQEVSNMMGGQLSAEDAKNRWKYLRDCYMKAKKKQRTYIPSGSGAIPKKKNTFRFFEQMKFLDDTLQTSQTSSSLPKASPSTSKSSSTLSATTSLSMSSKESECSISSNIVDDYLPSPKNIKYNKNKKYATHIDECILDALKLPVKQSDATDGFLLTLGEGLRKLPYRQRTELEIKFLSMVMEATTNNETNE
ncbi:hypothetical protein ALC62_12443 [Cyphomyrmex costatus]|uniref:MADF domain-containing protein n=1 Tax=Cyphomyrmex costatus TaxID=456900 RepID=A0A151IBL4_9HYME|nr:hypothetical protein ALC62_12443 [Cyphomyrmex costatus]